MKLLSPAFNKLQMRVNLLMLYAFRGTELPKEIEQIAVLSVASTAIQQRLADLAQSTS